MKNCLYVIHEQIYTSETKGTYQINAVSVLLCSIPATLGGLSYVKGH